MNIGQQIKRPYAYFKTRPVKHPRLYVGIRAVFSVFMVVSLSVIATNKLLDLLPDEPTTVNVCLAVAFLFYLGAMYFVLFSWHKRYNNELWHNYYAFNGEPLTFRDMGEDKPGFRRLRHDMMTTMGAGRLARHKMEWIDVAVNPETGESYFIEASDPKVHSVIERIEIIRHRQ